MDESELLDPLRVRVWSDVTEEDGDAVVENISGRPLVILEAGGADGVTATVGHSGEFELAPDERLRFHVTRYSVSSRRLAPRLEAKFRFKQGGPTATAIWRVPERIRLAMQKTG